MSKLLDGTTAKKRAARTPRKMRLRETPNDEEDGKFSLNFRTNPMGEVDGVEISLDEAAVIFTRQVPAALTADATLAQYAGTYTTPSGGQVVVTFQPGRGLALRGGPELRPGGRRSSASRNSRTW